MDLPILPRWRGCSRPGQRRELRRQWHQLGHSHARYPGNVFRLRLLSDAYLSRGTRKYFQGEPRTRDCTCRRIARTLNSPISVRSVLHCQHWAVCFAARTLRQLRDKQGFSQEAFADHCGLHRTAVSLIERGKRVPSLTTLLTVSRGFGIPVSELLRGVDRGVARFK